MHVTKHLRPLWVIPLWVISWWRRWCEGVDDLLPDTEVDVAGVDDSDYGSLTAPKFKVVQRCL